MGRGKKFSGREKAPIMEKPARWGELHLPPPPQIPSCNYNSGLGMMRRWYPAPTLSPMQTKKKEACGGDDKSALI